MKKPSTKFSKFFYEATPEEREKVFLKASREATREQEKIIKLSNEIFEKHKKTFKDLARK